jgi:hypothetical protein
MAVSYLSLFMWKTLNVEDFRTPYEGRDGRILLVEVQRGFTPKETLCAQRSTSNSITELIYNVIQTKERGIHKQLSLH